MIHLIAELIEALNEVASLDLICIIILESSKSRFIIALLSGEVLNSNKIESYTILAKFSSSKSIAILLLTEFKAS
jgi:hypothetical protein